MFGGWKYFGFDFTRVEQFDGDYFEDGVAFGGGFLGGVGVW